MQQPHKILIAAGGTGGHLFPAQALAQELKKETPSREILFAGQGLSSNPYFRKELFPFREVSSATPFRKNIKAILASLWLLLKGIRESFKIMKEFRPDLVVGFGSFHAFPVMLAAVCKKVPLVLFESNAHPGKVNRLFSRWALLSAVQFREASSFLSGATVEVAMPTGQESKPSGITGEKARSYFGLDAGLPTFLIFGGSQGALSVNRMFCKAAALLKKDNTPFQIIHLAGRREKIQELQQQYASLGIRACVKEFEEQMEYAWKAASLAVCRSGAATLAELLAFEVPAILIPYPYAADDHQHKNALFLEKKVGGALLVPESHLDENKLAAAIENMLDAQAEKLHTMRLNIRAFKEDHKKESLCSLIGRL